MSLLSRRENFHTIADCEHYIDSFCESFQTVSKPRAPYVEIIVETYLDDKRKRVRVRPVEGEAYPPNTVVECTKAIREAHPVGTRFRIRAKLTDREGGTPFLYSHYAAPFEVL